MGELSRTIGIAGEQIVIESFLKLIGWNPSVSGLDVKCTQKKHERGKHGIDGFLSYECPLSLYTQENVYISVKYESKARHTKENLLNYITDLTTAGECFRYSERYKDITSQQDFEVKEKRHSHVLFCLNHDASEDNTVIKNFKNNYDEITGQTDGVYLVDNQRMTFLYLCIKSIKSQIIDSETSYEFCYHPTGANESYEQGVKFSGKMLPVHFINSPVIPVKIKNNKAQILLLYVRENFDKDIFRRMIGLAQNLTNGWGNKVVIHFPDYQYKSHREERDSVLSSLKDKNFASIVSLSAYEQTFKILEEPISNEVYGKYVLNESISVDTLLPFGEKLRQLISQSYIDKRDLHTILKRRGIIIKKTLGKLDLIPLFRKLILSPTEFEYLRLRQVAKEGAEKRTGREIRATNDDILSLIKEENIPINEIVSKATNGCVLVNAALTRNDKGEAVFSYQVQKQDISKDWSNINSTYRGSIIFKDAKEYLDGYKNNVSMTYDSVDTRLINKAVFDNVLLQLRQEGVAKEQSPMIMYASELMDSVRNDFLIGLINLKKNESKLIKFRDAINIETVFNDNEMLDIPEDLLEYKNRVRQSTFDGNNLHELRYLKDKKYKKYFIIKNINAEFKFDIDNEKGIFRIEYGYPTYRGEGENKSEFEFKILNLRFDKDDNVPRRIYQSVESTLQDEFDRIVALRYEGLEKKNGIQATFLDQLN